MSDARTLVEKLRRIERRYRGREMPGAVAREYMAGAKQVLETETKGQHTMDTRTSWVPDPILPPSPSAGSRGADTPGSIFAKSNALLDWLEQGKPRAPSAKCNVGSFLETKALPTIGTSPAVIAPFRDPSIVRATEYSRLTLRDLVGVMPCSSNMVEYIKVTSDQPSAAATWSSGPKPESTIAFEVATAPVRTLAVHMPVAESQLEDFAQLQGLIDTDLRFDVSRLEEFQMVWGDGLGSNLLGIMPTPGVTEFTRTPNIGAGSTVTLLDQIRGAISEIRLGGLEPSAVAIHPYDTETVYLNKGSDDHYLAGVYPSADGTPLVFSVRLVESPSVEEYRSGDSTPQRVVLVGDFARAATLWDRHAASIEIGFVDDQFIRNQRTIRCESRVAFAVRRPHGFRYIETVAAIP